MAAAVLDLHEVWIRSGLALLIGLSLGFEREGHGRAAGLKTTALACVSSAIAMILSDYLFGESASLSGWRPDPARLAQGILTGMGFLGAGAIIRQNGQTRGVTTAAVLWYVSILGLVIGSGHLALALIGWAIAMVTLFVLPHLENRIKKDHYAHLAVVASLDGPEDAAIRAGVRDLGIEVMQTDLDYDLANRRKTLLFVLKYRRGETVTVSHQVVERLVSMPGVLQVKWG